MTSYIIDWVDNDLLSMVSSLKSARVTGSFARGDAGDDSDLDIKVRDADLQKLKLLLKSKGLSFDSELPGHITVDGFEIYTGFKKQKPPSSMVWINGLEFKTW